MTDKKVTSNIHPKWRTKSTLHRDFSIGSLLSINDHEFIAVSTHQSNGIWKYNMNKDEFSQFFKYPEEMPIYMCRHSSAINQMQQEIYLYDGRIGILDLKNGECTASTGDLDPSYGDSDAGFLFINGHFHIIQNYNDHIIINYKQNTKALEIISDTSTSENAANLSYPSVIYIPSKQSILLLGGTYEGNDTFTKELWIYSLITQKWKLINDITFEGYEFGAVLSSNEQYIILLGGKNDNNNYDDPIDNIFVLDMKNENEFKLKKSTIPCPNVGKCYGARTGGIDSKNEILVIGFIKECFKQKEFENLILPPFYIMKLIANWYSAEMIHWISESDGEDKKVSHYCIKLKDILSTTL